MLYWVGITDRDWFETVRGLEPDEVNFWQPSERVPRKLETGCPFLFKLHSPLNYIVGGGFFVRFTVLPCFVAWDAFREKNGASSLNELMQRTARYRKAPQTSSARIGCNVLAEPFFLEEEEWIPIPHDWPRSAQRGYTYDTGSETGNRLWRQIEKRLTSRHGAVAVQEPRFGEAYLTRAKLGQGTFRTLVADAYHRRCAVTAERSLPALEAAHIKAHAAAGPNRTQNGLLLRADIHRLFDDGYVTVDPALRFVVSSRLREEFENGRIYYELADKALANLPDRPTDHPRREFLEWHNSEVYLG
ncbi:MAG: HNH endonuclease [Deltaproteobacteria bacterium]|nr:HNH endonuclease [Deltaproteobacteria bacterium]